MNFQENAFALVIGIASYHEIRPLSPVVVDDARCIHAALTEEDLGGYIEENSRLLVDEQAGAAGIRQGLAWLARGCDAESTAFLFFSGHGARIHDIPGQVSGPLAGEYLLPYDARSATAAEMAASAISAAEFSAALRAIRAPKVVVVLDCCHAGGIGEPKSAAGLPGPRFQTGLSDDALHAFRTGRGRAIIASSRSDEVSWVLPGQPNSLFTRHLLAGLRGGVTSEDGLLRVFDLFEYIQPRVTSERNDQHPVFKAELEDNFPFALAQGGRPRALSAGEPNYEYDAYLVFTPDSPDAAYVWNTLVPALRSASLRLAVSGVVEGYGVNLVLGVERAIAQSRRTVLLLSNHYLAQSDNLTHFQGALAAAMGVLERKARVLPLIIDDIDRSRLPFWLASLWPLDLSDPFTAGDKMDRLVQALKDPLPDG